MSAFSQMSNVLNTLTIEKGYGYLSDSYLYSSNPTFPVVGSGVAEYELTIPHVKMMRYILIGLPLETQLIDENLLFRMPFKDTAEDALKLQELLGITKDGDQVLLRLFRFANDDQNSFSVSLGTLASTTNHLKFSNFGDPEVSSLEIINSGSTRHQIVLVATAIDTGSDTAITAFTTVIVSNK